MSDNQVAKKIFETIRQKIRRKAKEAQVDCTEEDLLGGGISRYDITSGRQRLPGDRWRQESIEEVSGSIEGSNQLYDVCLT